MNLSAQVRRDGRLVAILSVRGPLGRAVLAEPTPSGLVTSVAFDCCTAPIPAWKGAAEFVF
jgi:hypothetical protein